MNLIERFCLKVCPLNCSDPPMKRSVGRLLKIYLCLVNFYARIQFHMRWLNEMS